GRIEEQALEALRKRVALQRHHLTGAGLHRSATANRMPRRVSARGRLGLRRNRLCSRGCYQELTMAAMHTPRLLMPVTTAAALLFAGCASTRLDAQWSDPQLSQGSLHGA